MRDGLPSVGLPESPFDLRNKHKTLHGVFHRCIIAKARNYLQEFLFRGHAIILVPSRPLGKTVALDAYSARWLPLAK